MIDEEARELERRAREGDPDAKAALERIRARTGASVCDYRHAAREERVCRHLLEQSEQPFRRRFTGVATRSELLCASCTEGKSDLVETCAPCFERIEQTAENHGFFGAPGILERESSLSFEHATLDLGALLGEPVLAIAPVPATASHWAAYTRAERLHVFDASRARLVSSVKVAPVEGFSLEQPVWLHASAGGELAVVANRRGQRAAVVETASGRRTMLLDRKGYHPEVSNFPAAFVRLDGRDLLVHGSGWNRLDMADPATGACVTERSFQPYRRGEPPPPHLLDYFHGGLHPSPDGAWIVDNGWVWHPVGIVTSWSLRDWLANPFESEDGPSRRSLSWRSYFWDGPLCWVGPRRVAVWGYGDDDENLIAAALIYDVETGKLVRWFAGPRGDFFFDRHLVVGSSDGTTVWDVETGERLLSVPKFWPRAYHKGSRIFATLEGEALRLSTLRGSA